MLLPAQLAPSDHPAATAPPELLAPAPMAPPVRRQPHRPAVQLPWRLVLADLVGAAVISGLLLPRAPATTMTLAWWLLLAIARCHTRRLFPAGLGGLREISQVALVMLLVSECANAALWPGTRGRMLLAVALTFGWLALVRVAEWGRVQRLPGARAPRKVLLVGTRRAIADWMTEMSSGQTLGLSVVGACVLGRHPLGGGVPTVLGLDRVTDAVAAYGAEAGLVVPCPRMPPPEVRRLAWRLETTDTELLVAPGLADVVPGRATLGVAGSWSVLHVRRAELTGARRIIKDVSERALALAALLLVTPLLAVLMVRIRLDSAGGALYRQRRVGRGGHTFTMYKLRTMVADAAIANADLAERSDSDGVLFKMRADPRVTAVGRMLRRYSLDELPQLWNVVRGDMALVGPRPALPEEVELYDQDMRRRMVVKPGLTGLWQVSGRSDLPWSRAVQLDLFYVDNWSLGLDLAIVLRTVHAVLAHAGAY